MLQTHTLSSAPLSFPKLDKQPPRVDHAMLTAHQREVHYATKLYHSSWYLGGPRVGVYGTARSRPSAEEIKRESKTPISEDMVRRRVQMYEEARQVGEMIGRYRTETGHQGVLFTGAGPGAMEASSLGATQAGAVVIGSRIYIPTEKEISQYLSDVEVFQYFFPRKAVLTYPCHCVIAVKGGMGTLDEMFEAARLIKRSEGCLAGGKIILFGEDMYGPLMTLLRQYATKGYFWKREIDPFVVTKDLKDTEEVFRSLSPVKQLNSPQPHEVLQKQVEDAELHLIESHFDLQKGMELFSPHSPYIFITGGSTLSRNLPVYRDALALGEALGRAGANIFLPRANALTLDIADRFKGAGRKRYSDEFNWSSLSGVPPQRPGICAGIHDPVYVAKELGAQGGQILVHEERVGQALDIKLETRSRAIAEVLGAKYSKAHVFYPGGVETLDSFFEIICLKQTGKMPKEIPTVCVGQEYWTGISSWLRSSMGETYGTISLSDFGLFHIVDTHEEALEYLRRKNSALFPGPQWSDSLSVPRIISE